MNSVEQYNNKYRVFNSTSESFIGPTFETKEDGLSFMSWYDGDISYIGTWVDERSWDELIYQWKLSKDENVSKSNKGVKKRVTSTPVKGKNSNKNADSNHLKHTNKAQLNRLGSGELLLQSVRHQSATDMSSTIEFGNYLQGIY